MPTFYTLCPREELKLNSIQMMSKMMQRHHMVIWGTNQHGKRFYKQQQIQHLSQPIQPEKKTTNGIFIYLNKCIYLRYYSMYNLVQSSTVFVKKCRNTFYRKSHNHPFLFSFDIPYVVHNKQTKCSQGTKPETSTRAKISRRRLFTFIFWIGLLLNF